MLQGYEIELLDALQKEGFINDAQKAELMTKNEETQEKIEDLIIRSNFADEEKLVELKGKILNVPGIDLREKEINPEILNILPKTIAETHRTIAFDREGNIIHIATPDPRDFRTIQAIDFLLGERGLSAKYFISSSGGFKAALSKYEVAGKEIEKALEFIPEKEEKKEVKEEMELGVLRKAPVAKIVDTIMRHAVEVRASDIHVEPSEKESRVRYRVDGVLQPSVSLPISIHPAVVARIKVLANLKLDETRIPQDGRIRINVGGENVDFRVSTLPLMNNEKVVMRILEGAKRVPTLEELGFRASQIKVIMRNIAKPHGMFLITGPTGSGKSTTLYSILNILNKETVNIITLEDPIEYYIPGINQAQIRPEVGFTFATGLRSILRQDPNIVMVGEIRDIETAEMSIHAGLTGHLIFSTIHTNDALGAIPRLVDMKAEPFLIASTLNLVMAQRLARKICEYCKEAKSTPAELENKIRSELVEVPKEELPPGINLANPILLYEGKGCARCNDTGYQGRISIGEVFEITDSFKKIIVNGYKDNEIKEEIKKQGMISMKQDGILKALAGLTTIDEIFRATKE